jgi:hypothetical protein
MTQALSTILSPYSFQDKLEILKRSDNARHSLIAMMGFGCFSPLRNLAQEGKLNIIESQWFNGNQDLEWVEAPDITKESAYSDDVMVTFDIRDFTIIVEMEDRPLAISGRNPRCEWKIQSNAELFERLIGEQVNFFVIKCAEQEYERQQQEARYKALSHIVKGMHSSATAEAPAA